VTQRQIIVYCGLLLSVGAFSIDITLPFFGPMASSLAAPPTSLHATVTLYIFFLGVGQLAMGSLADRFGRRPVIAAGLGLYAAGAVVALFSGSLAGVLAGRAMQGLGGAVGPVLGRAMVRDVSDPVELPRNMAVASGIFAVGPIFAPLVGVALATAGGSWRAVFVAMCLFALGLFAVLARLPETLRARNPAALAPAILLDNARRVLGNRQSRFFMALAAIAMVSMVTIIAGLPRLYEANFGVSGALFAVLFGLHGVGIVLGQFLNHRLIGRIGTVASAIVASLIMSAACLAVALMALTGAAGPYAVSAAMFVFAIGYLIVFSNATAMTLEPHGAIAGFASSFFGFFAQVVSSALGTLAVALSGTSIATWSMLLLAVSLGCLLALIGWQREAVASPLSRKES
jgi:DHA1 family bicyclomycin/chloramphenicol resistance-like MFS transporter